MTDQFAGFRTDEKPTDEKHAQLQEMVHDLVAANDEVAKAEAVLKKAQGEAQQLREFTIPEFMTTTLGLEEITTKDGIRVWIVKTIRAAIGDRKAQAYEWLIKNNHDALIKRTVVVAFNREQTEDAEALMEELGKSYAGVKQDMKVEAATLTSWVKEQLRAGIEIPHDIFGIFEQRYAKFEIKK